MRISVELRGRTKRYASGIVRFYVALPKQREEGVTESGGQRHGQYGGRTFLSARTMGNEREELRAPAFAAHRQVDSNVHSPYFCRHSQLHLREEVHVLGKQLQRSGTSPISHLLKEADELLAIFTTIVSKVRRNGS